MLAPALPPAALRARSSMEPIPADAGIGLRFPHHAEMLRRLPPLGFLEVHAENYMGGGQPLADLQALRRDYPVSLHAVGLSLGSAEGVDPGHLARLADLCERIEPTLASDHLAWTIHGGTYLADLLPLPLNAETLEIVVRNVEVVQTALGRQILVENPSAYLAFAASDIPEPEFLNALARRSGCGLLCDVNNIHVSAANTAVFDPVDYLDALDAAAVGEIHLAGHTQAEVDEEGGVLLLDDHGSPVPEPVWRLYDHLLSRTGSRPTLVEWDQNIPPLQRLLDEAAKAGGRLRAVEASRHARVA